MRKKVILHLVLALVVILYGIAAAFTPSGLLEIHYINVGWGTSVLVIGPDGTRMLMDGGQSPGSSHVIPYMESLGLMPTDGLTYIVASHLHTDHINGLTLVMNSGYDVTSAVYYNGSTNSNSYITAFKNAAAGTSAGPVQALAPGTVIQLGNGATATCVCANGTVLGHGPVSGVSDENDLSIGLLIQYGHFDYLFAGDLGGGDDDHACTGRSSSYANVESPLAQAIMPGGEHPLLTSYGVEVFHVNHHGSEGSTNSDYMNILTPHIACIATGSGQSPDYMFPRHDVVDNVLLHGVHCITAPAAIVLQNEEGFPAGSLTSYSGYCVGDITIKTAGVSNYIVNGDGAVTEGPDERAALGMPLTIPFDEPVSDTTAPAVVVISPNGGEQWNISSQHNITWTATDSAGVASYAIDYSTNSGTNWIAVQPQTNGNPQTFPWTVPSPASGGCLVRVKAWDPTANMGNDLSNAVFSIILMSDTVAPVVNVTSPNGGESWDMGTSHNITWIATDNIGILSYKLEYSTDSGSGWLTVQDWTAGNPGTYSWLVPNVISTQCRIRVLCRDGSSNTGLDISDADFTITDPPPTATLTAPNGAEIWDCGSSHNITWTDSDIWDVTAFKLECSTDAGVSWSFIQDWTNGDPHTFAWAVSNTPTTLARVRISCRDTSMGIGTDISNNNFTIRDNTAPTVTVTDPNGGESWDIGSAQTITWNAADNVGVIANRIDYSTDGGSSWIPVHDWVSGNPGIYSWTVPNAPSARCRVRVLCRDVNLVGADNSDADFTIRDETPPQVVLTSPNGGESWDTVSVHNIAWSATDNAAISAHKLDYSTNSGADWIPIMDWTSGNPGIYSWTVPNTPSSHCKVRVFCRDDAANIGVDSSLADFSIDDFALVVTVNSPNGGEIWEPNTTRDITWAANDNISVIQYKIECSIDAGASWFVVQDWIDGNPQTYPWNIPNSPSTQCLVRVSCQDTAVNITSDNSDDVFTINNISPQCDYVTGDLNDSGNTNGIDVVYGVTYFKGGPPPEISCDCPPHGILFVTGDVNSSCSFNGLDITYFVAYFKGGPSLTPCPDCPPTLIMIKRPAPIIDPAPAFPPPR